MLIEKRVGPFNRGLQCAVALGVRASAAQQLKSIVESKADLGNGHRPTTCGRQFDSEGDAIQLFTDLFDLEGRRLIPNEIRANAARPGDKELATFVGW